MEQLDFENFISSSSNWFSPFDGDGAYLTASRQILETITEETSEDEENNGNWSQYEHEHSIWSSESETGSVIRMEVHNDQDSISERDLACPAKRPRHDDFIIGGIITTVPATAASAAAATSSTTTSLSKMSSAGTLDDLNIRKFQRSDEFFDSGNSFSTSSSNSIFRTKPIRDDFFSDSDSLSYNSLSRSSSLIQFESLERQLLLNEQTAASSSVGNSSPSLLSFEAISTTTNDRGSSGCLKRYESIDTRLHQTYYDLDKITFDEDNLLFSTRQRTSRSCSKSDSESSDNSILSHEERILRNPVSHPPRSSSLSIPKGGGRNSAENLSEDSGYCDGNGIVVKKSKSLQNFEFVDDEKYKQNSNCNIKIDPKGTTNQTMDDKNKRSDGIEDVDADGDGDAAPLHRTTYLSVSLPEISVRGNRCCARRRQEDFPQEEEEEDSTTRFCSLPIDLQSSLPAAPFSRRLIVDLYRDRDDSISSDTDSESDNSLNDLTVVANKNIMSSRRNSDGPSELGKGNFLLDEISDHFNKNLSILNDRENSLDAEEKYKQIINKFIEREGDEDGEDEIDHVHHVKLTIRKPPRKERTSTVEVQTISQHLSKTFDQDPTNLTTSYATSLEKCNFDSKELSQTDLSKILPKRRFRTAQKKRGLVSSTPNLNENINDLDDDELCISSAHASCAQLAPIGILVQAGSKQSVGKEVSFCPVVSKYSWAEQSSEECNDASTSTLEETPVSKKEEEEDFEAEYIHDDKTAFNTQFNEDVMENTMNILPSVKTRQSEPIPILKEQENKKVEHHNFIGSANMFHAIGDSREIVNGSATTIATEQRKRPTSEFLDNERRISDNVFADVITKNKSNSSENLSSRKKLYSSASTNPNQNNMSSSMTVKTSVVGDTVLNNNNNNQLQNHNPAGNNNYLMNSKFKVNEKSPNKGFFSRFTNGFRFSLRRKKKDKSHKSADNSITSSSSTSTTSTLKSTGNNNNHIQSPPSPDFIYIPLKGQQQQQHNYNPRTVNNNSQNQNHVVVTGKPPLPTPPRIVGVSEKVRASGPAQDDTLIGTPSFNNNNKYSSILTTSSPAQTVSVTPVHCNANFLEHERGYYEFKNQLADKMNGANNDNKNGASFRQSPGYSTNFQNKIGLIETNLDTHETKISGKTRSLMELGLEQQQYQKRQLKIHEDEVQENGNNGNTSGSKRPHKSMEFLLDKENQKNTLPPENELRKTHENSTALSEHQLRVQASLQRLNIPDWFKQYNPTPKENGGYKPGNFSRKRTQESARWTGLNSKTTSLSSLGSQKSERNLILLSPSAHSHHGQTAHSSHTTTQQTNGGSQGFGRWSTSHLNSNQISPSTSGRNTFTRGVPANSSFISVGSSIRNSYRTPYLGWRSQEKLAQPRTPHERLASTLLANKPAKLAEQPEYQIDQPPLPSINHPAGSPEIQSSIKEVTSAIVHYVNDQNNRAPRSRSVSPNSRCWLESSFVGTKPVVKVVVNENGKANGNGNDHDHEHNNDNDNDHDNDDTSQSQSQLEVEIDNPIQSYSTPPSPRCWLESSFVGLKPVDSPQTPVIETSTSTFSNLNSGNNTNISSSNNNTTLTSKNINTSNTSGMNGGVDGESSFII
ncbi:C9orf172 family protein [Megaselia abdita]